MSRKRKTLKTTTLGGVGNTTSVKKKKQTCIARVRRLWRGPTSKKDKGVTLKNWEQSGGELRGAQDEGEAKKKTIG